MIVAAASCPNPPLLMPGATGEPVAEVEELRRACLSAIDVLVDAAPAELVVVAARPSTGPGWGIQVAQSLLAGVRLPVREIEIGAGAGPAECRDLGDQLAAGTERRALLVMADGSARRGLKAPGYLDDRAAGFDDRIRAALATADPAALAALEPDLAEELIVAGRACWQVLAAATGPARWRATMHYSADPFGVYYPVASWT